MSTHVSKNLLLTSKDNLISQDQIEVNPTSTTISVGDTQETQQQSNKNLVFNDFISSLMVQNPCNLEGNDSSTITSTPGNELASYGRLNESSSLIISSSSSQISQNNQNTNRNTMYSSTDQGISSSSSILDGLVGSRSGLNQRNDIFSNDSNKLRLEDFNDYDLTELGFQMNKLNNIEQFKEMLFNSNDRDHENNLFSSWNQGDNQTLDSSSLMNDTNMLGQNSSYLFSNISNNVKRPNPGNVNQGTRSNGWANNPLINSNKSVMPTSNNNNAWTGGNHQILQSKFDSQLAPGVVGNSRTPLNNTSQQNIRGNSNMTSPKINNNNLNNVISNNSANSGNNNGQSSNQMYNLFPKRPHHRMMALWKQQQQQNSSNNSSATKLKGNMNSNNPDNDGQLLTSNNNQLSSTDSVIDHNSNMSDIIKSLDSVSLSNFYPSLGSSISTCSSLNQTSNGIQQNAITSQLNGKASTDGSSLGLDENCVFESRNASLCNGSIQNREEGFSRKVFVGGLPPDIDEEEITTAFRRFGDLLVDWPHKSESKAYFPPKGYCFLLFVEESSVQTLINACIIDEGKYYWCVSSPTMKDKPVQIRPWNLADSDYVMDAFQPLDPRKTIFVGGVPRPLKAVELALIMDRLYGGVCYAGIDTDPDLKYPKGAGRVAFSNQQSYISAISARFVQLQHNDIDKRVEVKPYVLDNQMCDECQGARCGGKFAPFFCANVSCLQYYCEQCWLHIHSRQGREFHKPLVKEGADRPRANIYRW